MFVFRIVCLSARTDLFILLLKAFLAALVSVCLVSPRLSGWYSPEPRSTLLLSHSRCSAPTRAQTLPPPTLTAISTGTQGLSIFPLLLRSSPIFLRAVFKLLNFQTCTADYTCACKSAAEYRSEISAKFQSAVITAGVKLGFTEIRNV